MINKKHLPLILAFTVPLLLIVFIAISIYVPNLYVTPKFNFLYSISNDYYINKQFVVQNGKLIKQKVVYPKYYQPRGDSQLYIFDTTTNTSKQIDFDTAKKLSLDSNVQSPDGYSVIFGKRSSSIFPILFWSSTDYRSIYIKKNNGGSKKLNITLANTQSFQFLGWIK